METKNLTRDYNDRDDSKNAAEEISEGMINRSEDAGERDYDSLFSTSSQGEYRHGDRLNDEGQNRDRHSDESRLSRSLDTSRFSRDNPNDRFALTNLNGIYDDTHSY